MSTDRAVEAALSPVLDTLAADGYEGTFDVVGDTLRLQISAGSAACEDCLSPKEIMSRVVTKALAKAGLDLSVELLYPADASGTSS